MPAKNKNNPVCPDCGLFVRKNGFNSYGEQKYRCSCGWFYNGSKPSGGQLIGERKLSKYEKTKRHREKKKIIDYPIDIT